jgi:hypothetical protein
MDCGTCANDLNAPTNQFQGISSYVTELDAARDIERAVNHPLPSGVSSEANHRAAGVNRKSMADAGWNGGPSCTYTETSNTFLYGTVLDFDGRFALEHAFWTTRMLASCLSGAQLLTILTMNDAATLKVLHLDTTRVKDTMIETCRPRELGAVLQDQRVVASRKPRVFSQHGHHACRTQRTQEKQAGTRRRALPLTLVHHNHPHKS